MSTAKRFAWVSLLSVVLLTVAVPPTDAAGRGGHGGRGGHHRSSLPSRPRTALAHRRDLRLEPGPLVDVRIDGPEAASPHSPGMSRARRRSPRPRRTPKVEQPAEKEIVRCYFCGNSIGPH